MEGLHREGLMRGARPDGVRAKELHLIKNVSNLRLTNQIRLLTFQARETGGRLFIHAPKGCNVSRDLKRFVEEASDLVRIDLVG